MLEYVSPQCMLFVIIVTFAMLAFEVIERRVHMAAVSMDVLLHGVEENTVFSITRPREPSTFSHLTLGWSKTR